jgi:hypothetical protein
LEVVMQRHLQFGQWDGGCGSGGGGGDYDYDVYDDDHDDDDDDDSDDDDHDDDDDLFSRMNKLSCCKWLRSVL